uniref:methyltransferase-like protein 2 isoform X2 n=1 Tax=Erigeron canadensis TaxID=72917 RepID=UPI001CB89E54|nr:methyltransferase-like protein 2 isoform X2 [Erigeron canadensis]
MTENNNTNTRLSNFLNSGIYRFEDDSNAIIFMDPVRVLNNFYTHFRVNPSFYYSRLFTPPSENPKKRKRKHKKPHTLNAREKAADARHQNAKPYLIKAHECLLKTNDVLLYLKNDDDEYATANGGRSVNDEHSFVELGSVWQAPLYEISLYQNDVPKEGRLSVQSCERKIIPAFGSLVANETNSDMEADFLSRQYIIPKQSSFYMSDLKQIHGLIPVQGDCGFNLIVIDPPWENSSASQKLKYPTLPNRYFLSLPIRRLAQTDGALVALWVTNKEKLRIFVEKELFPKWGVKYMATHYWLKVKADGSLIGDLDLFHHRPYECLVLGYCYAQTEDSECSSKVKFIPDSQVLISVPGDYSRKPPVGGVHTWIKACSLY